MNIAELRAIAEAATPGPWFYLRGDEWSHSVVTHHGELPDGSKNCWAVATINKRREPDHVGNANHIATFNPDRVKALLDCVEALEKVVASTHSHVDGRDLLAELHPRRMLDIKRRVDACETWFEGDWLSNVWKETKAARSALKSLESLE